MSENVIARRSFNAEYADAVPQWQRNYEAGRQWATAVRAIRKRHAKWPEGERVPQAVLDQLGLIRRVTGSGTRPEDTEPYDRPRDDPAPLRAMVPVLDRRGRIVERITG